MSLRVIRSSSGIPLQPEGGLQILEVFGQRDGDMIIEIRSLEEAEWFYKAADEIFARHLRKRRVVAVRCDQSGIADYARTSFNSKINWPESKDSVRRESRMGRRFRGSITASRACQSPRWRYHNAALDQS
jgi:hypothetical protein